jgi:hypothetical protein
MIFRGHNHGLRRFRLQGLLRVLAGAVPALAADSIVYFKNGRALRVLNTRAEGEWI